MATTFMQQWEHILITAIMVTTLNIEFMILGSAEEGMEELLPPLVGQMSMVLTFLEKNIIYVGAF